MRPCANNLYPMPRPVIGCAASAAAYIASINSRDRRAIPRTFLERVSNCSLLFARMSYLSCPWRAFVRHIAPLVVDAIMPRLAGGRSMRPPVFESGTASIRVLLRAAFGCALLFQATGLAAAALVLAPAATLGTSIHCLCPHFVGARVPPR